MGHERGVGSTWKTAIDKFHADDENTNVAVYFPVIYFVPVRTTRAPEHSARAHRWVPPRWASTPPRARWGRYIVGCPRTGPWATAKSASAVTPTTAEAHHEKVRVSLVRRTTRPRQTTSHPDEHAKPAIRNFLRPSTASTTILRTHTRRTLTYCMYILLQFSKKMFNFKWLIIWSKVF